MLRQVSHSIGPNSTYLYNAAWMSINCRQLEVLRVADGYCPKYPFVSITK